MPLFISYRSSGEKFIKYKANRPFALRDHVTSGFYLRFIFWGRSPDWPKATIFLGGSRDKHPREFFEMDMHWDAICCILRHNFEKCYAVCDDLVMSEWFFQYSYLYTVVITIFFWGEAGHSFWRGSFYPSNTLGRTLEIVFMKMKVIWFRLRKWICGSYLKQSNSDLAFQTRTIFLKWVSS